MLSCYMSTNRKLTRSDMWNVSSDYRDVFIFIISKANAKLWSEDATNMLSCRNRGPFALCIKHYLFPSHWPEYLSGARAGIRLVINSV